MNWQDKFLNKIVCGDCIEVMKGLPDNCVDITITSPPYNLGDKHHTGNKNHKPYPDSMPEDDYQEWQIKVLDEIYRVTKSDGSLFYNHKNRIRDGVSIIPYQWLFKSKWLIKQEIVWRNGGQNFDRIRFFPQTERIYWLVKDAKTKLFNPISLLDYWYLSPVGTKKEHTRQFPEKLVENILCCLENSKIILDPFSGRGTTPVVAKKLGRHYIGVDISPEYVNMSNDRLGQTEKPLF